MNKKTKRLFSLLLALVMIMTSIPIVAMPVMAASASPTLQAFGLLKSAGDGDRLAGTTANIIWDAHGNGQNKYTVAYWVYDISDIQYANITSSNLRTTITDYVNNGQSGKSLEFYWIPQANNSDTFISNVLTNGTNTSSGVEFEDSSNALVGGSSITTDNVKTFRTNFLNRYSNEELMFSISHDDEGSFDNSISDALQKAVNNGEQQFIVAAIQSTYFQGDKPGGGDKLWSDSKVTPPTMTVEYTPPTTESVGDTADWGVWISPSEDSPRIDTTAGTINVISDNKDSNKASIAFWEYNIPAGAKGMSVVGAKLDVEAASYHHTDTTKSVDFFFIPQSYIDNNDTIINGVMDAPTQEYESTDFPVASDAQINALYTTFKDHYKNPTLLLSKPNDNDNKKLSDDTNIKNALATAVANGDTKFVIAAIQKTPYDDSNNGQNWSDAHFKKPTISITYKEGSQTPDPGPDPGPDPSYDYNDTTINPVNDANAVTGRVNVGNVIYTSAQNNPYNYGTWIYDTKPYYTPITINSGTLSRIELVDANGKVLTTRTDVNHPALAHQDTGLETFKANSGTDVTATLRFVFTDGMIEYHRVAVKSVPVEAHLAITSQQNGGTFGTTYETSYETTFEGSFGSIPVTALEQWGSGNYNGHKSGNWGRHNTDLTKKGDVSGGYFAYKDMDATEDKTAGFGAYVADASYVIDDNRAPTARYYIDTSNLALANGNLYNTTTNKYTIEIPNVRWVRYSSECHTSEYYPQYSIPGVTYGIDPDMNATNSDESEKDGKTFTTKLTYDKPINANNQVNFSIQLKNCDQYSQPKAKLYVDIFTKYQTRNYYNQMIADANYNDDDKYTATAYAAYLNALLNAEAYLSDFQDTTNEQTVTQLSQLTKRQAIVDAKAVLDSTSGQRGKVQEVITAANAAFEKTKDTQYTEASRNALKNTLFNDLTTVSGSESGGQATFTAKKDVREISKADVTNDINAINFALTKLVGPADFTALDAAYKQADDLLTGLDGKDAVYTSLSLQALINAVNQANLEGVMTPSNRPNIFSDQQYTISNNTKRITEALDGLVQPTVDLSTYKAMNNWLDSYDKDVYSLTPEELNTAQSGLDNAALASDLSYNNSVNGHTATLNVFRNDIDSKTATDAIDAAITNAMTTMNDNIVAYTISATNASIPNVDIDSNTAGVQVAYGTSVTFTATDSNKDTAWYMTYTSTTSTRTEQFQTTGATFTTNVFGNIEVEAHSKSDTTPNKVTIVRDYKGTTQATAVDLVDFVADQYVFTLPAPTAAVGYAFTGYTVDGETKAAGDQITITKDTRITANYEYDASLTYTVIIDGVRSVHKYNDKIELNADAGKVWVQDLGNGSTRLFYGGSSTTIFVTGDLTINSVASYTNTNTKPIFLYEEKVVDSKLVFNGQVALPDGCTIKEYGVLIGRPGTGQITEADLIVENAGRKDTIKVMRCKSTKPYGAEQFTIRVSGLVGKSDISFRGYLIYEDANGNLITTYTNVMYY